MNIDSAVQADKGKQMYKPPPVEGDPDSSTATSAKVENARQTLQTFIDENTISTIPKNELENWWLIKIDAMNLSYDMRTHPYYSTSIPYKKLLAQKKEKMKAGGSRRKLSKRKSRKSKQYRKKSYRKHKKTMKSK